MSTREPRMAGGRHWVGASVPRHEDPRLLTGRGTFVDDIHVLGMLHAQFVRSGVAAGRITALDLEPCRAVPGVVAVFDAADLDLQDIVAVLERPLDEFVPTRMPVLARDRVRFVGEPLAIVVATDPYAAEDGVEAAEVTYDTVPAVTDDVAARAPRAPRVHDELTGNVFLDVRMFATDGIDEIFESAAAVVSVQAKTGRQNATPLETRGALAEWQERSRQLHLQTSTQVPHQVRTVLAETLGLAEHSVRVMVPDMGGAFGLKCVVGREEIATAAAAYRLRRPVKWIEDRRDALHASFLGREQRYDARAAFDADGRILALDADIVCDMGAYSCYPFTAGIEPLMASAEMPSVYKVPAYRVRGRAVATNKAPTAPYRGVSRPQYVMVIERLFERAARELRLDPVEIRRRNVVTQFPYTGINGVTYDPGSYLESLELCWQTLCDEDWYQFRDRARQEGRVVGIGYSCFNERTGYGSEAFAKRKMSVVPGFDISEITMDLTGAVTVTTGTQNHGQSHETTLAQIVADKLTIDVSAVRIVQGDTDRITYGWGSYASRSLVIGGGAVAVAAGKLTDKLRHLAAHLLDVDVERTTLVDGRVQVIEEPDRALTLGDLANVAYLRSHLLPKDADPGLSAVGSFDMAGDGTFSNATHGVVVELDPGTGQVRILRYVCVEDCGVAINPKVVDGQCRGGIAQGIAGALFEEMEYAENGEPLGTSFIEYRVPTANEIPDVLILHLETPCIYNETGAKGVGEGGTIGAPAAIINAVNDALAGTGVELNDLPIRPAAVLDALARRSEQVGA